MITIQKDIKMLEYTEGWEYSDDYLCIEEQSKRSGCQFPTQN